MAGAGTRRRGLRGRLAATGLVAVAAALSAALAPAAAAAGAPTLSGLRVLTEDTSDRSMVTLTVSIPRLATGQVQPADDFGVTVRGHRVPLAATELPARDLRVAVVLDTGGTAMALAAEQAALVDPLLDLPGGARVTLLDGRTSTGPLRPRAALARLGSIAPSGVHTSAATVRRAVTEVAGAGDRGAVVVVGPGWPAGGAALTALTRQATRAGVSVSSATVLAGIGAASGTAGLRLAAATGGLSELSRTDSQLTGALDEISSQLLHRYRLTFPVTGALPATAKVTLDAEVGRSSTTVLLRSSTSPTPVPSAAPSAPAAATAGNSRSAARLVFLVVLGLVNVGFVVLVVVYALLPALRGRDAGDDRDRGAPRTSRRRRPPPPPQASVDELLSTSGTPADRE